MAHNSDVRKLHQAPRIDLCQGGFQTEAMLARTRRFICCFAVVVARFNAFVTERLLAGAMDGLRRTGVEQDAIEIIRVPGSFEIPVAARQAAMTSQSAASSSRILCLPGSSDCCR